MKRINLNGKELCICTKQQAEASGWPVYFEWRNGLVTITHLTKAEMVRMIGLDENKVDYALPQEYYDRLLREKRDPWQEVWYYGYKSTGIFGQPVNWYANMRALGDKVLELSLDGEKVKDE